MGEPKLEEAEEGKDTFEGEVNSVESDGCDSNPSAAIDSWVPDSSSTRRATDCLPVLLW